MDYEEPRAEDKGGHSHVEADDQTHDGDPDSGLGIDRVIETIQNSIYSGYRDISHPPRCTTYENCDGQRYDDK